MRLTLALLFGPIAICLGACSQGQDNLFLSSREQRIYANGLSIDVTNVENEAAARPFAKQYCNGLGKTAHFQKMELVGYHHVATMSATFVCD